jgi:hypothetical protein
MVISSDNGFPHYLFYWGARWAFRTATPVFALSTLYYYFIDQRYLQYVVYLHSIVPSVRRKVGARKVRYVCICRIRTTSLCTVGSTQDL